MLDFGAEFDGKNEYMPSYIRPCFELESLDISAFVMYNRGYQNFNLDSNKRQKGK